VVVVGLVDQAVADRVGLTGRRMGLLREVDRSVGRRAALMGLRAGDRRQGVVAAGLRSGGCCRHSLAIN
jgi:hypothetical protein